MIVRDDDSGCAVRNRLGEDLAGVEGLRSIRPMEATLTFGTSLAPLVVTARKCSCLRSAKCRVRGSASAGDSILTPLGLMRLRTNSMAATISVAWRVPSRRVQSARRAQRPQALLDNDPC
jgi:hypothetical protein